MGVRSLQTMQVENEVKLINSALLVVSNPNL